MPPLLFLLVSYALRFAATAPTAHAQSNSALADPKKSYDVSLAFGTLLPSRNGLTELVPGWSLKLAVPTTKGTFEAGGFSGIGNGIVYRSATLDYRMDMEVETILAHAVLGFHVDQYESETAASKLAGGWHYGGGSTLPLGGPLLLRFDFRHRFSPGQVLEVTLGLTYRLPENGSL